MKKDGKKMSIHPFIIQVASVDVGIEFQSGCEGSNRGDCVIIMFG